MLSALTIFFNCTCYINVPLYFVYKHVAFMNYCNIALGQNYSYPIVTCLAKIVNCYCFYVRLFSIEGFSWLYLGSNMTHRVWPVVNNHPLRSLCNSHSIHICCCANGVTVTTPLFKDINYIRTITHKHRLAVPRVNFKGCSETYQMKVSTACYGLSP